MVGPKIRTHDMPRLPMLLLLPTLACRVMAPTLPRDTELTEPTESVMTADTGFEAPAANVLATVTLDGEPVEGAWVGVGGGMSGTTDAAGQAWLVTGGEAYVVASHPDARTDFGVARGDEVTVALTRFSRTDNEAFTFEDPGERGERGTTAQCAHCHQSALTDWDASAHRTSASNPVLHDVYAGVATTADSEAACDALGGAWRIGLAPGTGAAQARCYVGWGTLPDLNDCGDVPCDGVATDFGACADCHAPGIDGVLGGRDLLEAVGRPHDKGVHCDVCHKVEAVDLEQPAGVAGALKILRPSENTRPGFEFDPLSFGPYPDVPNPRMGAVAREHFRQATLCAGCHQLDQAALVPGTSLDPNRWPDGTLPVHSTYDEWREGPYAPASPCQSCHMPPETRYATAADLQGLSDSLGIVGGWSRPPGAIRRHSFDGPRSTDPTFLRLALALDVDVAEQPEALVVTVTTTNAGAGHAVPTGEPYRSVLLTVEASCQGAPIRPVGGDVVPSFGGTLAMQDAGGDWTRWPGASVGDQIRVVRRNGFRDYLGPGPFGDGRFDVAAKGLPLEAWVDEATVTTVNGDQVTLDRALAFGDVAYRVGGDALAGAPGFGFARVLADVDGNLQVPHHRAVDVVSDNRVLPQRAVTTVHHFATGCATPEVTATLVHRGLPLSEARQRGWPVRDTVMAEVTR